MKAAALLFLIPAVCLSLLIGKASAFDLFSNCIPQSGGTQICGPCKNNPTVPSCKSANTTTNPIIKTINTTANILALATGIGAVILIIVGGITLSTSGGNSERIASGRRQITYALIGLVVVGLAWLIISFVTARLIK